MKEDIFEELHYHSGLVAQGCWDELDEYDREAIKRFGDLIVKRCVEICNDTNDASYLNGVFAGRKIKEHFGIKE